MTFWSIKYESALPARILSSSDPKTEHSLFVWLFFSFTTTLLHSLRLPALRERTHARAHTRTRSSALNNSLPCLLLREAPLFFLFFFYFPRSDSWKRPQEFQRNSPSGSSCKCSCGEARGNYLIPATAVAVQPRPRAACAGLQAVLQGT